MKRLTATCSIFTTAPTATRAAGPPHPPMSPGSRRWCGSGKHGPRHWRGRQSRISGPGDCWTNSMLSCWSEITQEGVATAASRRLHPGLSDSGYLWTDDQHDPWVRECREAERALITVVLEEMATPSEAPHVRGLFAPDCQASGLPPRSGYWLADLLAQR